VYPGVKSYEVSLEKQTAEVVSESLDYNAVLTAIKKTGKKVKSGEADGESMPVEVPAV
jgi:copper chaperone